jgi:predicted exporter
MNGTSSWRQLVTVLMLLAALAVTAFAFVPVRADVTVLMPEHQSGELGLLLQAIQEGPANRIIMIAVEPAPGESASENLGALSRAMKTELRESGLFEEVLNGEVQLDDSVLGPFFKHRYQLNPPLDPASFSAVDLRSALEALFERLQGFGGPLVEGIMNADPTLRSLDVAALWQPNGRALKRQGIWISGNGRRVLLLATTAEAGLDFSKQQGTIQAIESAAAKLEATYGRLHLAYSGPSVIAVESRQRGEAESKRLMFLSVPVVALILMMIFRHWAVLLLAGLPLLSGFLVGAAVVATVFGFVHVTTLGFGAILIGVAVDYPLHLLSHLRGDGLARQAARRIWPALLLGVTTTIVGFLPLIFSSFPGVAQLGIFTVAGLATAAATTRWLLPRVIPTTMILPRPSTDWVMLGLFRWLRHVRPFALALGVVALGSMLFRGHDLWQRDIAALSPVPEQLQAQDRELRQNLGVVSPRHLLTVAGADLEEVLRRSEALMPYLETLKADGGIEEYELAARYIPSAAEQQARLNALPDEGALRNNLASAQSALPYTSDAFEPFLRAVQAARTLGPIEPADLESRLLRLRLEGLLLYENGGYRGLVLLRGLRNPDELQGALLTAGLAGVSYLDIKEATQDLMDGYRAETLLWATAGGGLALVLLIATIRAARGVGEVVLPVGLSVLITAASVSLFAGGLTIFHLLALLMVAGLGIDYAVFLRRRAGPSDDDIPERSDDVRAVCLCALTSFAVFAILASASMPLLSQIGSTVALGSVLSLILSFAFTAPWRGRPV